MRGLKTFCFSKYLTHTNGLFSENGLFNQKSRTPVRRPLISFFGSVIERNPETRQLHPTRLTQESVAQRYFWEGGQARFVHCPLHLIPRILDGVHIRPSRWPVNEFDVCLQR